MQFPVKQHFWPNQLSGASRHCPRSAAVLSRSTPACKPRLQRNSWPPVAIPHAAAGDSRAPASWRFRGSVTMPRGCPRRVQFIDPFVLVLDWAWPSRTRATTRTNVLVAVVYPGCWDNSRFEAAAQMGYAVDCLRPPGSNKGQPEDMQPIMPLGAINHSIFITLRHQPVFRDEASSALI
jgi:hypothetical protein